MNVYDLAQKRLEFIFNEFDNIYVSFSGGKDSGVLLNLTVDYAKTTNQPNKLSVFHIDYEAQYQFTTDYVDRVKESLPAEIDFYHICVPFKVPCTTSMHQSYWRCWDDKDKDIWVRDLPKNAYTKDDFSFFNENMWDYDFQEKFSEWIHNRKTANKTACLVGIRTQESLNRWRAIHSDKNYRKYKNKNYSKKMYENVYNFYPIYDWITEDIWTANAKFDWEYNKLYDLYYQAGLNIDEMRVASPFISTAQDSLKLYRVIEPNTWSKLVSRVNGVNFTGIYGGTTAMGWKNITKPDNMSWKEYMEFLLSTLPKNIADNYRNKLKTSIKFWKEKGGVLDEETISELSDSKVDFEVGDKTNYKTIKKPVRMNYQDDFIGRNFKDVPTYKRMCVCIMKNDHLCKYMGFTQTKYENDKRVAAIKKYKEII